jgi:hypothetical protein
MATRSVLLIIAGYRKQKPTGLPDKGANDLEQSALSLGLVKATVAGFFRARAMLS